MYKNKLGVKQFLNAAAVEPFFFRRRWDTLFPVFLGCCQILSNWFCNLYLHPHPNYFLPSKHGTYIFTVFFHEVVNTQKLLQPTCPNRFLLFSFLQYRQFLVYTAGCCTNRAACSRQKQFRYIGIGLSSVYTPTFGFTINRQFQTRSQWHFAFALLAEELMGPYVLVVRYVKEPDCKEVDLQYKHTQFCWGSTMKAFTASFRTIDDIAHLYIFIDISLFYSTECLLIHTRVATVIIQYWIPGKILTLHSDLKLITPL